LKPANSPQDEPAVEDLRRRWSRIPKPAHWRFVADAHSGGKRFIVPADNKLTTLRELEPAIWFVAYYRRYQFAAGCGDEIRAAAARSDAASA
jgi:hypothetical protein